MTNILDFSEVIMSMVLHDLASNISAIGNGIEMMDMAANGNNTTNMLNLTQRSSEDLVMKFKFLRFIFTRSDMSFKTSKQDLIEIIENYFSMNNIKIVFSNVDDVNLENLRSRLLANLMLIIAQTMPKGGEIVINTSVNAIKTIDFELSGKAETIKQNPDLEFILVKHEMRKLKRENAYIYYAAKILGLAGHIVNLSCDEKQMSIKFTSTLY